jgi:hypothetical protein
VTWQVKLDSVETSIEQANKEREKEIERNVLRVAAADFARREALDATKAQMNMRLDDLKAGQDELNKTVVQIGKDVAILRDRSDKE